jgi:hypothetical protein
MSTRLARGGRLIEAPLFTATFKKSAVIWISINFFINICVLSALGWVLLNYNFGLLEFVAFGFFVLRFFLGIYFLTVRPAPLTLYSDRIEMRILFKTVIPIEKISGLCVHPKRGDIAFYYNDPEQGHEVPMVISWKYIEEHQDDILEAIRIHYGFVLKEPKI